MARKQKTTKRKAPAPERQEERLQLAHRAPVLLIGLKMVLISTAIFLVIRYSDSQGYFRSIDPDDHTVRKWEAFYDLTERKEVDVLLVGNSHLYTGINPKNLSAALGVYAFILAAPGTQVADHYFALEEALQRTNPKLVVVETYGIRETAPRAFKDALLSDQFKSFDARKNVKLKLVSTPHLFQFKNYPYAWSTTLRNHRMLLTDFERFKLNREINQPQAGTYDDDELYLGRFVRFGMGIQDSIIARYDSEGAPVQGKNYKINQTGVGYLRKIIDLCQREGVELMFLTVPMYERHIADYGAWKSSLGRVLGDYGTNERWLDLQVLPGYAEFNRASFENTYAPNQHLTYKGSLLATYRLADFINAHKVIRLPDRKNDPGWKKTFYAEEGFFENLTPDEDDEENVVLFQGAEAGVSIEILQIKGDDSDVIMAKLFPQYEEQMAQARELKIRLTLSVTAVGQTKNVSIDLMYDASHSTAKRIFYVQRIKKVDKLEIVNLNILPVTVD